MTKWLTIFRESVDFSGGPIKSIKTTETPPLDSGTTPFDPFDRFDRGVEGKESCVPRAVGNVIRIGPNGGPDRSPPDSGDPHSWPAWHAALIQWRIRSGHYSVEQAERLAFGEALEAWRLLHPFPFEAARCPGCGNLRTDPGHQLPDGARVHWTHDDDRRCLIAYGRRWRRRAAEGLEALGIVAPQGWAP